MVLITTDNVAAALAIGTSVATWLRSLKTSKRLRRELTRCHRENQRLHREMDDNKQRASRRISELKNRVSALNTEMVTLRKLLPGGEWYRKLGLDKVQE